MSAEPTAAALEPVRQRLRRDAENQAARIRAAANAEAAAIVARAHQEVAAALAGAAGRAERTAAPVTAAELRQARDTARSAVLTAKREAFEELRGRVRATVAALPAQPGYDRLLDQLTRIAGRAAGPDAEISADPAGGVVAQRPGVLVDCSLARLADLAVAEIAADVPELWAP